MESKREGSSLRPPNEKSREKRSKSPNYLTPTRASLGKRSPSPMKSPNTKLPFIGGTSVKPTHNIGVAVQQLRTMLRRALESSSKIKSLDKNLHPVVLPMSIVVNMGIGKPSSQESKPQRSSLKPSGVRQHVNMLNKKNQKIELNNISIRRVYKRRNSSESTRPENPAPRDSTDATEVKPKQRKRSSSVGCHRDK